MHLIILGIGILIGLYGLYRFMLAANLRQVVSLFLAAAVLAIVVALFFLAVTGRLGAALGMVIALWPLLLGIWKRYKRVSRMPGTDPPSADKPMSRHEALDILGLPEGADEEAIRSAHKRLIKKLHPDQDGSAWLAARINQARDKLLK